MAKLAPRKNLETPRKREAIIGYLISESRDKLQLDVGFNVARKVRRLFGMQMKSGVFPHADSRGRKKHAANSSRVIGTLVS